MKGVLGFVAVGFVIGFLAGCTPAKVDFTTALPKEGWHAYTDTTRGVTCFFYQHPTKADVYFGAGCVADTQWKKGG